jgi:hypothetical protein
MSVKKPSSAESKFMLYWRGIRGPSYVRELYFHKPRRFHFDFAWPEKKVAVEIEGGVWINGGHTRGLIFTSNCEKYNLAIFDGWAVFRLTPAQIQLPICGQIRDFINAI